MEDIIEKLELINEFKNMSKEEIINIFTIVYYLGEMEKEGLITREEIVNISKITNEKKTKVINYINKKLKQQ